MADRPLQDGDFVAILNDFDASRLDYLVKFGGKWKFFKNLLISRSFVLCLLAVPMSTFSPNNMKKTFFSKFHCSNRDAKRRNRSKLLQNRHLAEVGQPCRCVRLRPATHRWNALITKEKRRGREGGKGGFSMGLLGVDFDAIFRSKRRTHRCRDPEERESIEL